MVFAVTIPVLVACSIIEYDEETDYGQVVIEIKPVSIEYKVPLYTEYKDLSGNVVRETDDDPSSANFGKETSEAVLTVKRDHNGDPIYETKKDGNDLLFAGYSDENGLSVNKEVKANDPSAVKFSSSDGYYIDPASGDEYKYLGISATTGKAVWKNLHTEETSYGAAKEKNGAPVAGDSAVLPTVSYDSALPADSNFSYTKMRPVAKTASFEYAGDRYFKQELALEFARSGQEYLKEEGMDVDKVFDRIVKNMYSELIYVLEAEVAVKEGKIDYGVTERNEVNQHIYSAIETALSANYDKIATNVGRSIPEATQKAPDEEKYPTRPSEEEETKDYKVWHISQEPERCINTAVSDKNRCSLERAGFREFLHGLSDTVDEMYSLTKEQKEKFTAEVKEMNEEAKTDAKIAGLFKKLYKYEVIRFLYGDSTERSIKSKLLEDYVCRDLSIDEETITKNYTTLLNNQIAKFDAKIDDYYSACEDSTEQILYFADNKVFFVKHILLPFSEEQTARLTAYKTSHTDAEIRAYRDMLASTMTVYRHVKGNDDLDNPMSLYEAFDEIYSKMAASYGDSHDALLAFEDLIYDFNTDPGIFNNEMGYAVKVQSAEFGGPDEKYMLEFARESRALYQAYKAGKGYFEFKDESTDFEISAFDNQFASQMRNAGVVKIGSISSPVITDYGVHILMLNYVPQGGYVRSLGEYMTEARVSTVRDAITEDLEDTIKSNKRTAWQNLVVNKFSTKVAYDSFDDVNDPNVVIAIYKTRFQNDLDKFEKDYLAASKAEKESKENSD